MVGVEELGAFTQIGAKWVTCLCFNVGYWREEEFPGQMDNRLLALMAEYARSLE